MFDFDEKIDNKRLTIDPNTNNVVERVEIDTMCNTTLENIDLDFLQRSFSYHRSNRFDIVEKMKFVDEKKLIS